MKAFSEANSPVLQWDNLRYFLALYRHQKLVTAGRSLNVDHTTVSRRIRDLENYLDTKLFEKNEKCFEVTHTGKNLLAYAENVEKELMHIKDKVVNTVDEVKGKVNIVAPESFMSCFFTRKLPELITQHKNLRINLMSVCENQSQSPHDFDVLISHIRPTKGRYIVKKLFDYDVGLFASRQYIHDASSVGCKNELLKKNFLSTFYTDECFGKGVFPIDNALFDDCNITTQYQLLVDGAGLCFLPKFMINPNDNVIQIFPETEKYHRSYWLLIPEDFWGIPRVKAVSDFISSIKPRYL